MSRLLYYGCTAGTDVASLQNDLNLITAHTQQGSALAPLAVDGIFGSMSQARVLEFQRINGLQADGVVGEQTRGRLDELFLSEPCLQLKRIRGGVPGGSGDISGIKQGEAAYGKMPPTGSGVSKGGGFPAGGTGKTMGTGGAGAKMGGMGKPGSNYGYKG